MTAPALLAYLSAVASVGVLLTVLCAPRRSLLHWAFAAGMSAMALMALCLGLRAQATQPLDIVYWQFFSYVAAALLPGAWLLFSLSFGRLHDPSVLTRWKYGLLSAVVCPLGLVALGPKRLFLGMAYGQTSGNWVLSLGWAGYGLHLCFLLSAVVILMHLERTLRVLVGNTRWQVKFLLLGLGTFFAAQIYTSSQALLFSAVDIAIESIHAYAVLLTNALIMVSLMRDRHFHVNLSLSHTVLHSSLTVAIVGIYLLSVGLLAKAINYFGANLNVPVGTFFVFLSLVALTVVLLSDELRYQMKHFINRHVYRSQYDYRKEWMAFTERTATVVQVPELCTVACHRLAETFGAPAVTIWLSTEDAPGTVTVGGSTAFTPTWPTPPEATEKGLLALAQYLRGESGPLDVETSTVPDLRTICQAHVDAFRRAQIRYVVSLSAGHQWLGFLSLSARHTLDPFGLEDQALLKTMADQTAARLLNLQLLQRVVQAKQMEMLQALSAFFVHDLKNLAAKLSLMTQNLPRYYDNPVFRDDAMHVIAGSVATMNAMCGRLSLMTRTLELQYAEVDLNELVDAMVATLRNSLNATVTWIAGPVPLLRLDADQISKVVENLVLNAHEAMDEPGEIRIETTHQEPWVVLTVSDTGRGMTRAFLEHSLFHPFRTTKSQGLGIGLFHSRTIVEAHRGHIDVASVEGQGSTFHVCLPVRG